MGCSYRPLRRTQHLLRVLSAEEVVCVKSIILKIKSTQKNAWSVALCTHICYSHNPTGSWDLSFSIGSKCPRCGQTPGSFLPVFQGSSAYGWIKKKSIEEPHLQVITGTCGYWLQRMEFPLGKTHKQEAHWTAVQLPRDTEHLEIGRSFQKDFHSYCRGISFLALNDGALIMLWSVTCSAVCFSRGTD